MGESGAGKTTLLNVLARRFRTGAIRGDILVNGSPLDQAFGHRTGYVESQDIHPGQFTVREALRFSAQLRQLQKISTEEKYNYVEDVIEMLGMNDYADAVIGEPETGLSLEQRKRTTASTLGNPGFLEANMEFTRLVSSLWQSLHCCSLMSLPVAWIRVSSFLLTITTASRVLTR